MTQAECIKQAIGRIRWQGMVDSRTILERFAAEALEPMTRRDQTEVDGLAVAEKWNPETHTSDTVTVQLHRPRRVAPYIYGPADVLWLEWEIRRRAGL